MSSLSKGRIKSWFAKLVYQLLTSLTESRNRRIDITASELQQLFTEQSSFFFFLDGINFPKVLDQDWLDFFEWLGNQSSEIAWRRGTWSEMSQSLAGAYIQNPTRLSLLNILSLFVIRGNKCYIPENLLVEDHLDKESLQVSALLIRLAQGKWSVNEVPNLARQIASFFKKDVQTVWSLTSLLDQLANRRDPLGSKIELLALTLRNELIANNQFAKMSPVIGTLNNRMRTRTSQLGNKKHWMELGLPVLE